MHSNLGIHSIDADENKRIAEQFADEVGSRMYPLFLDYTHDQRLAETLTVQAFTRYVRSHDWLQSDSPSLLRLYEVALDVMVRNKDKVPPKNLEAADAVRRLAKIPREERVAFYLKERCAIENPSHVIARDESFLRGKSSVAKQQFASVFRVSLANRSAPSSAARLSIPCPPGVMSNLRGWFQRRATHS